MKLILSTFFLLATLMVSGQTQSSSLKTDRTDNYTKLITSFQHPAASARPWVYYFPLDGNLTKEGITADFEAMVRVGIGGILYMEVDQGAPKGKADFAGPEWMNLISHAFREAKRLGLEINMNNDAGWNGSGGPWITPEMSTQKVVWSELVVDKTNLPIILPQPKSIRNYYKDIVVLAMPAPKMDVRIPQLDVKSSANDLINRDFNPLTANFNEAPTDAVIPSGQVIDLTSKMDAEGKLNWTPPAGKWLVMRFGHTITGKENHPAPKTGMGLECDKLSKAAAILHFDNLMKKIIQKNKGLTGKDQPLVSVHIDSWENGAQNWTQQMREEFH
ncbi:MAG TPA: glycosyl hydrolase, partial [Bacteroidales bacterium]